MEESKVWYTNQEVLHKQRGRRPSKGLNKKRAGESYCVVSIIIIITLVYNN